jgi:DNA-binding transcriptional LysR family regulator
MSSASMTEAAERLHVSQPAVSTVLKHAEQRLGMKLFQRAGGRLIATPEALALFPDVTDIFTRLEALGRMAKGLRDAAAGVVSVAASPTLLNALLPAAIAAFAAERPQVQVMLKALPTEHVMVGVRDRAFDLGLMYEPAGPQDPLVATEVATTSRVVCVMPQDHPLAAREQVGPADLASCRLVTFGPATPIGGRLEAAFRTAGVPFQPIVQSDSSLTSYSVVAAGGGVALLDSLAPASGAFPTLVIRPFVPRIDSHVLLAYRRDRPRSRLAAAFARKLVASAGEPRAPLRIHPKAVAPEPPRPVRRTGSAG